MVSGAPVTTKTASGRNTMMPRPIRNIGNGRPVAICRRRAQIARMKTATMAIRRAINVAEKPSPAMKFGRSSPRLLR